MKHAKHWIVAAEAIAIVIVIVLALGVLPALI